MVQECSLKDSNKRQTSSNVIDTIIDWLQLFKTEEPYTLHHMKIML